MRFWDRRDGLYRDRCNGFLYIGKRRYLTTEGRWAVAVVAGGVLYVAWLAI